MSAARPKIADYPFTTLIPNLGVAEAGDVQFVVADVPGLIPGASEGKGLGHDFLRHVERCSALVHVLDCATHEPGRDPISDLDTIEAELAAYEEMIGPEPGRYPPHGPAAARRAQQDRRPRGPRPRRPGQAGAGGARPRGLRGLRRDHEGLRELRFAMAEIVEQPARHAPNPRPSAS